MKTILVVEDDPTMRELLKLHLTTAGYAVRTASDGLEAGHAVLGLTPDLIITDVRMPHMNGFELVEALRQDPRLAGIPVIFLTIEGESVDRGTSLDALEYLTKPIQVERLLQKVAKHLPVS